MPGKFKDGWPEHARLIAKILVEDMSDVSEADFEIHVAHLSTCEVCYHGNQMSGMAMTTLMKFAETLEVMGIYKALEMLREEGK